MSETKFPRLNRSEEETLSPLVAYDLSGVWIPDKPGKFYEIQLRALKRVAGSEQLDEQQAMAVLNTSGATPGSQAGCGNERAGAAGRRKLDRLREESRLLALPLWQNGCHYPEFQFDLDNSRLHYIVEVINSYLQAARDPWGVASWWLTENGQTDNSRPAAFINIGRDDALLAAARSAMKAG